MKMNEQKIKAIIFDLDDTLYDFSNKIWLKAIGRTIKFIIDNGLPMEFDKAYEIVKEYGEKLSTKELLSKIVKESGLQGEEAERLIELGRKHYYAWALDENLQALLKPFPDVPQTLERLKKRYKLILITFGLKEAQEKKIDVLGLRKIFDLILISDLREEANKIRCFKEVVEKFNLKPEEVVSVGDKIDEEIRISNQLGMITVRILQGRHRRQVPKDKLSMPRFTINKISQLPSILNVLEDSNVENIFRAYDIRGVFGVNMDEKLVENLGKALGEFFGEGKTIAVGRDARLSGEIIERALIKGVVSMGCNVLRLGVVPTQVAYFSVPFLNLDGGVMITASHNPPDWNGFKLLKEGGKFIFGDELLKIKEKTLRGKFKEAVKKGDVSEYNKILDDYVNYVTKKIKLKRSIKVVLDTGNGVAGKIARKTFEKAGCNVAVINEEIDGNFPSRPSEPDEFSLEELARKVVEEKADFGAGFDGDGDRIMFVDDKGRVISSGSLMIMLFADYFLKKNKGEKNSL